ncbi:tyrosine--tRNA ligase [candidate division WOR-3 bacterium]|nr:tyrosine--tRNA ligase [candidate division WOR-3 bacterium]
MNDFELIKRGTADIITEEELIKKLKERRPLRVKLGIDPTAPDIHLGLAVPLRKLRKLQDLGHTAILIVGDFTAKIGDPSGVSKTRPVLTDEDIKKNMARYKDDIFQILLPERTEFRYNSEWCEPLTSTDIIRLAQKVTLARIIERDDFEKRLKEQTPISLHELLYPLFQAYDSVYINADIELGGTDQTFNLLIGRELQREYGQTPQICITLPLLEGLDGTRKMSKSYGNYISIKDPPKEIFGKIMSIPDSLIIKYYELCTDKPDEEIEGIRNRLSEGVNPRDIKVELAKEIVQMYCSKKAANDAEKEFETIFRDGGIPRDITTYKLENKIWIVKLLQNVGFASSGAEARRLISQGAVELDGEIIKDINFEIDKGGILRVGKRRFIKLIK